MSTSTERVSTLWYDLMPIDVRCRRCGHHLVLTKPTNSPFPSSCRQCEYPNNPGYRCPCSNCDGPGWMKLKPGSKPGVYYCPTCGFESVGDPVGEDR